jgi:hypothetical protein
MTDSQYQLNLKKSALLNKEGYNFDYNADGYKVTFNGEFVGAAEVKLPRSKPLHWRHKQANIKDNLGQCIVTAEYHKRSQSNEQATFT